MREKIITAVVWTVLAVPLLFGYAWYEHHLREQAQVRNRFIFESCRDGVAYLEFPTGVSVAYTGEGKIKTCEESIIQIPVPEPRS